MSLYSFFGSFYYTNTFVSPVDWEKEVSSFELPEGHVREVAQNVTASSEVRKIFSSPFCCDNQSTEQGILEANNLISCGKTVSPYSTLEVTVLPCYEIKPGCLVPNQRDNHPSEIGSDSYEYISYSSHDALLSLQMNRRMQAAAQSLGLEKEVVIPKEYAVPFLHQGETLSSQYFILREKLLVPSREETCRNIAQMKMAEQCELASKLSKLISKIGYANALFDHIRIGQGKIYFLATDPSGLLSLKGLKRKGHSVEKCARIGLYLLYSDAKRAYEENGWDLELFSQEIEREYEKAFPTLSWKKVVCSVLCPLIPLYFLWIAFVRSWELHSIPEDILQKQKDLNSVRALQRSWHFQSENKEYVNSKMKQLKSDIFDLHQRRLHLIEGVCMTRKTS